MTKAMRHRFALALLSFLLGLQLLVRAPATPLLDPDSNLYLTWGPYVPLVYPAFVHVFPGWSLIAAQVMLYASAVFALVDAVWRLPKGKSISVLLLFALFANPQTDTLLWSVLSEGLFLSLLVLLLALLITFVDRGDKWTLLMAALAAGVCAATRPASVLLGFVAPLACLLRWEKRTWLEGLVLTVGCVAVWSSVIALERFGTHLVHGDAATSLTGPHLFGKAALLDVPDPMRGSNTPQEQLVAKTLENDFAPVRRLLDAQRPTLAYPPLLAFYEVCIQHKCSLPMREQLGLPPSRADALISRVALDRLRQNPFGYLRLTWDEYRSLWVLGLRSHPVLGPAYDRQVAQLHPLPFEGLVAREMTMPSKPSRMIAIIRPVFIAIGVTVAVLCVFLLYASICRSPSRVVLPSLLAAISTEAVMAFTAMAGIGDGRYTMGIWPSIISAVILASLVVMHWPSLLLSMRTE